MTTAAWVLIVWTVAMDGLPNLPIEIRPGLTFNECHVQSILVRRTPNTMSVCRPMLKVKP